LTKISPQSTIATGGIFSIKKQRNVEKKGGGVIACRWRVSVTRFL
jgi:hypothetical protein